MLCASCFVAFACLSNTFYQSFTFLLHSISYNGRAFISSLTFVAANMGHYYQVHTNPLNWANAKSNSESLTWFGMRGHLATVESASEHAAIQRMIEGNQHWIGGNDLATEGVWKWESGPLTGQPITRFFWAPGAPNGGRSENCLLYHEYNFHDDNCANAGKYLVEFECAQNSTCTRMLLVSACTICLGFSILDIPSIEYLMLHTIATSSLLLD
jgi:hypothetical protein